MTRSSLEGEWERQPDDPDFDDLGYELDEWERSPASGVDSEKFLCLPEDEEMLRQEACLVVSQEDAVDLLNNR